MDLEDQSSYSLINKAQNIYLVLSRNNKYLFLHLLSKHRPLNPGFLTSFLHGNFESFLYYWLLYLQLVVVSPHQSQYLTRKLNKLRLTCLDRCYVWSRCIQKLSVITNILITISNPYNFSSVDLLSMRTLQQSWVQSQHTPRQLGICRAADKNAVLNKN